MSERAAPVQWHPNDKAFIDIMLELMFDPEDAERWDGLKILFPSYSTAGRHKVKDDIIVPD